ncbi:MAG TPA: HXXEE domain-containing protein [Pyrinomonadaceae bacterium]|nr:HXXEE domain-containing protein [Pyrinomonadaceae bacterium]
MLESFSNDSFAIVAWLALFPVTYLAHITEEYWAGGGYSKYLLTNYSVELSPQRFLLLQGFGLFLMALGIVLGILLRFPLTMMAMLSSIVLGNAMVHSVRSINGRGYTPGLFTAVLLWLPLGAISLLVVWPLTSAGKFALALGVGVATNCVVEVITMRSRKGGMKDEG